MFNQVKCLNQISSMWSSTVQLKLRPLVSTAQVLFWWCFWGGKHQWRSVPKNCISSGAAHAPQVGLLNRCAVIIALIHPSIHPCICALWPPIWMSSASIEAAPPVLPMARRVQGRLTPCWVPLQTSQAYTLWQARTFFLTSLAPRRSHLCWCLSASLRSTVVSFTTFWTAGKGACLLLWFIF